MQPTGLYVFCFAEPGVVVDGVEAVSVQSFEGCSAVTTEVMLDEFAAGHLEDLAWLAPRACRHEAVVEAAMRRGAVLPVRFGTIFSSLHQLAQFVAAHRDRIVTFLRETAGREEWGVKALVDTAELERCEEAAESEPAAPAPGTRYLRRKQLRAERQRPPLAAQECAAAGFADDLARLACALVARRPVSEPGRRVLKNWAFLVPKQRADEFRSLANAAAGERSAAGLEFRISGPWPPYSFVPELPPVAGS